MVARVKEPFLGVVSVASGGHGGFPAFIVWIDQRKHMKKPPQIKLVQDWRCIPFQRPNSAGDLDVGMRSQVLFRREYTP